MYAGLILATYRAHIFKKNLWWPGCTNLLFSIDIQPQANSVTFRIIHGKTCSPSSQVHMLFHFIKRKLGRMRPFLLKKGEIDTFFMSQTLVLSIKLATVICYRWFKMNFEPWKESNELQNKTCKQQVYFSSCVTLLPTVVSYEVKSSNYRCQNSNHRNFVL